MQITKEQLDSINQKKLEEHKDEFRFLRDQLGKKGTDVETLIQKIQDFQVAIPSWALGAGGTRFGRFSYGGEPGGLEDKINIVISMGRYVILSPLFENRPFNIIKR